MRALEAVEGWPHRAAAGAVHPGGVSSAGSGEEVFEWASVTKLVTALAIWVAMEEGVVSGSDPAGPPGSTLAHLLAHASGLAYDSPDVVAPPGRRRIYSNSGFEVAAEHVARAAAMPFERYAAEAVLEPLGMSATTLAGSPAWGARGPLCDLIGLARELAAPTLVDRSTHRRATAAAFPGLAGVLPGYGRQPDNSWGLGVEIRDHKHPHWTGTRNSPSTFGHFGRSGSFLWVDPEAGVALASLSAEPFGPWTAERWPRLADAVLAEAAGFRSSRPGPSP